MTEDQLEALSEYLARVAPLPYRFGTIDCVSFVADCLSIGFGRDYHAALRYTDRRSAVARLRAAGGLRDAVCDALGEEWPIESLTIGDVAYIRSEHGTIGIILPRCIAVKANRTIHRFEMSSARFGWKTYGRISNSRG